MYFYLQHLSHICSSLLNFSLGFIATLLATHIDALVLPVIYINTVYTSRGYFSA